MFLCSNAFCCYCKLAFCVDMALQTIEHNMYEFCTATTIHSKSGHSWTTLGHVQTPKVQRTRRPYSWRYSLPAMGALAGSDHCPRVTCYNNDSTRVLGCRFIIVFSPTQGFAYPVVDFALVHLSLLRLRLFVSEPETTPDCCLIYAALKSSFSRCLYPSCSGSSIQHYCWGSWGSQF